MKSFTKLVEETLENVNELLPWDLEEKLAQESKPLLLDIREPYEFEAMHIEGSLNVPRGILEAACDYGYEDTVPELVKARDEEIIVICRSGNRSVLAAHTMQLMGYQNVVSLKTGLRGWSDYEQPLVNAQGERVSQDECDDYFESRVSPVQLAPD